MYKVFISSPYSGEIEKNLRVHHEALDKLVEIRDVLPFAPLLWHYQDQIFKRDYGVWLELALDWLTECDIVLRLPGDSKGADHEVDWAKQIGIKVVYSFEELESELNKRRFDNSSQD